MKKLSMHRCVLIMMVILLGIACIEICSLVLLSSRKGTIQDIVSSQPQYALLMISSGIYVILGYILYWYHKQSDDWGMYMYLWCLSVCLLLLNNIVCALFSFYMVYRYRKEHIGKMHMQKRTVWFYGSHMVWVSICIFYFFMKETLM